MTPDQSADNENAFRTPGSRFREARSARGLSIEAAAARLRIPMSVVEAIERDDYGALGAAIYVRGHCTAYARLLGLAPDIVEDACRQSRSEPPPLVPMAPSTRLQRFTDRAARRAVYIVLTGAIVLPVIWYATQEAPEIARVNLSPLDVPPGGQAPLADIVAAIPAGELPAARQREESDYPVVASLAPPYAKPAVADEVAADASTEDVPAWLVLSFNGPSWVEVFAADGTRIEQALLGPGSERRYAPGQVARITLGNAEAVEVRQDGKTVDLSAYRRANVARFTVSSDGTLAPVGG